MIRQKLLIIDDSDDVHELVRAWLADQPVDLYSSSNGSGGLEQAAAIRPDLILLDVNLPGMDGFEVCKRLKSNPLTADVPIVFLTGASSTEEKLRGLELGATDYITKPFDPAELRARVRSALMTRHLMDLLAQKALTLQESEERFRLLAENSSDAITRHSPDGVYLYASPSSETILGHTPQELVGRKVEEFIHSDDISAVTECFAQTSVIGDVCTIAFRFKRRDGQLVWLESTCRILTDPATGMVREIQVSSRDISNRKQMENREAVRAEVLEMIAQSAPLNDILRKLIDAAERQEPQAIGAGIMLSDSFLHHCAPHLPPSIAFSIERQMYHFVSSFTVQNARSDDRIIVTDLLTDPAWTDLRPAFIEYSFRSCWSILILSGHRNASGAFSLYRRDNHRPNSSAIEFLKLASELTGIAVEHRQLTDQLTFQARHDTLTQLPNRALFSDRLEQGLASATRTSRAMAVLLIDVDRFKHVNDSIGHQAGDEMLCAVSQRLAARLRKSDTLARMGGDEFALILAELAAADDAELVAKMLVEEFRTPIQLLGREFSVSVSIGVAVFPKNGIDAISLLKNADLALYRAKDAGRNTARVYTADMSEGTVERIEIEDALRLAISNGELRLHYQPIVDQNRKVVALEALVRWEHPKLGLIPPVKFIPLAEDTGIILPIGAWVLNEAARQIRAWDMAGIDIVPIAVNVSTLQFTQPDFVRTITDALLSAGLQHQWLEIELTESVLMGNMHDAADKLSQLKEKNVRVAIDDFGTGYSSLAYLQRLAIDTLKIDQSFIKAIEPGRNARTIISAIVSLAKNLELSVIAEGVETEDQREFLLSLGCDLMQGYLFSHAGPPSLIERILRRNMILPVESLSRSA